MLAFVFTAIVLVACALPLLVLSWVVGRRFTYQLHDTYRREGAPKNDEPIVRDQRPDHDPAGEGGNYSGLPIEKIADVIAEVNARVERAYAVSSAIYVLAVGIVFLAFTSFPWSARIAAVYGVLLVALAMFTWWARVPRRRWTAMVALYSLGALMLAFWDPHLFHGVIGYGLVPLPALLLLCAPIIRPFLAFLAAVAFIIGAVSLLLLQFFPQVVAPDLPTVLKNAPAALLGAIVALAAMVLGRKLLLQQRRPRVIGFTVALTGTVVLFTLPSLPDPVLFVCSICFGVLQMSIGWLLFQAFSSLFKRRVVTNALVQNHLCWIVFTAYLEFSTVRPGTYTNPVVARWGFLLALLLCLVTLHTSLYRISKSRFSTTKERLLLLRVFGRTDEREDLLADLDHTWRRIGAVDLIASSDVATRTLSAFLLEAFFLGKSDEQFIHDSDQVNERLQHMRSNIEADARYPENAHFCHESIWEEMFDGLSAHADVFLMDLRGFTSGNKGCVKELTYLLQYKKREKIVFIVDDKTDKPELKKIAGHELSFIDFERKTAKARQELLTALLRAAYGTENVARN